MKIYHKSNENFHKHWLILTIISSILGLIFGIIGFSQIPTISYLNSIYFTSRLFLLNFDIPIDSKYPLILEWGRWFAFFTFFSSIIQGGIKLFNNQIRNILLMFQKNHYIIVGINEYSISLTIDLLKQNKKVIIIDGESDERDLFKIVNLGGRVVIGDVSSERLLKKIKIHKASNVIIFSMNDTFNLNYCLNVKAYFGKLDFEQTIKISIHLHEKELDSFMELFNEEMSDFLELRIFNVFEIGAQLLLKQYPIHKENDYSNIKILIIELNEMGQSILSQIGQISNFGIGKKVDVTIMSTDLDAQIASLLLRFPEIEKICKLKYFHINQNLPQLLEKVKKENFCFTDVYICYPEEQKALITSQHIRTYFTPDTSFYIYNSSNLELTKWIDQKKGPLKNIYCFGDSSKIGSKEIIIEERLESLAKHIHNNYLLRSKKSTLWTQLSVFEKLSNLSQANHIDIKLHMLGLVSQENNGLGITEAEYLEIVENNLEIMGEAEHERWNAVHFMNGWKKCNPELEKDIIQKLHPCLVSWSELDQVSKIKNTDYKEYDYDTVRNIYSLLNTAGMQIVKKSNA